MSATIRDIKALTGLSLATISKYLNGGNVLPENRIKIEAAIKELHYEVNELARSLVTNKTRTVGVVVFAVDSVFNGTLLKHIGERLRQEGYGVLICDSNYDENTEAQNIKFLLNKKVDGIIVLPVATDAGFLEPAKQAGIPVVLMDRPVEGDFDCIRTNNRAAARKAVEVLIASGHKRIACISSAVEYTGIERYKGFVDAMEGSGLKIEPAFSKKGIHSIEYGNAAMKELMEMDDRPSAVFMTNYEITLGSVMALHQTGVKCPDDVSLIGFDDLILSHLIEPRISVVAQPMKEMGEKAAELILEHISSKDEEPPSSAELIFSARYAEGNSIRKI